MTPWKKCGSIVDTLGGMLSMETVTPEVFSNMYDRDYLSFFKGESPRYRNVVSFLEFQKDDVARATGVPVDSVRYDVRMPKELSTRIKEWAVLVNVVAGFFDGDRTRTALWFTTRNPLLGNVAPRDMVRLGRYGKLSKFIVNSLNENRRQG